MNSEFMGTLKNFIKNLLLGSKQETNFNKGKSENSLFRFRRYWIFRENRIFYSGNKYG